MFLQFQISLSNLNRSLIPVRMVFCNTMRLVEFLRKFDSRWFAFFLFLEWQEVFRCNVQHCWKEGLESISLIWSIEKADRAVEFIDELVVAWLCLLLLNPFNNPLFELEVLGVHGGIETELKEILAFPELSRFKSFGETHDSSYIFLVFVVIIWDVWPVMGGIPILVEEKSSQVIILEHEFLVS